MITDILGKMVLTSAMQHYTTGQHEIKLPVSQLAAGSYMYTVMSDGGEIVGRGKLMKE